MEPSSEQQNEADSSQAPRIGVRLMIAILIGFVLIALYANVQKRRRDQIEQVIVVPASNATPPAASPAR